MTYNGWTNYETWLTNLWFDNFDFTDYVEDGVFDDMDNDEIKDYVADYIESSVDEYVEQVIGNDPNGFVQDLITSSLGEVDWREIADHYVDDISVEVSLRNREAS